jgi:lipoprotein-anchoring transpeptidase ErfK/SrfK
MSRNEPLSRNLMLICFGTAFVLLSVSWRSHFSKLTLNSLGLPVIAGENFSFGAALSPSTSEYLGRSRLIVDLSDRVVYVYLDNQLFATYPVAVGQSGWETPIGSFQVLKMNKNPAWSQPITGEVFPAGAKNNPLGDRWISFWSDGRHQIGFHGTNQEQLVGQAVSHGCVRMRNQDIRAMYQQITRGTPVIVRR